MYYSQNNLQQNVKIKFKVLFVTLNLELKSFTLIPSLYTELWASTLKSGFNYLKSIAVNIFLTTTIAIRIGSLRCTNSTDDYINVSLCTRKFIRGHKKK